jgi:tRNA (cytidine56-2'-O)-methyltransferase
MSITVLRLGHRPQRDKRLSTHLLLAARAFGANNAIYTGIKDDSLESSIEGVVDNWGGDFKLEYSETWRSQVKEWPGKVIHLTMYGESVQDVIEDIKITSEAKLVVVGGAKVPGELYALADWNVAVTDQPHSEVSALAVFLHLLLEGKEYSRIFDGAKLRVKPMKHGKEMYDLRKD